jgi:hypothetical protein
MQRSACNKGPDEEQNQEKTTQQNMQRSANAGMMNPETAAQQQQRSAMANMSEEDKTKEKTTQQNMQRSANTHMQNANNKDCGSESCKKEEKK